jgi:hypothetical protein
MGSMLLSSSAPISRATEVSRAGKFAAALTLVITAALPDTLAAAVETNSTPGRLLLTDSFGKSIGVLRGPQPREALRLLRGISACKNGGTLLDWFPSVFVSILISGELHFEATPSARAELAVSGRKLS